MATLTVDQLTAVAMRAGWTGSDVATAVAVALAESGGDAGAVNRANSNGTVDYGLWQINSVHASLLANGDWSLPADNAAMAYKVWSDRKAQAGNGWKAWATYNNGSYLAHLGKAQIASPDESGLILGSDAPTGGLPVYGNDYTSINTFTSLVSDPRTWWRIGYFVGGVACMVIAARMMLKSSGVQGKVLGAVAKVVT